MKTAGIFDIAKARQMIDGQMIILVSNGEMKSYKIHSCEFQAIEKFVRVYAESASADKADKKVIQLFNTVSKAKNLKANELALYLDGDKNNMFFFNIESLNIVTKQVKMNLSGIIKFIS
jgi:hypothetical protein